MPHGKGGKKKKKRRKIKNEKKEKKGGKKEEKEKKKEKERGRISCFSYQRIKCNTDQFIARATSGIPVIEKATHAGQP